ncbi:MAG: hypothetical protein ACHQ6U_13120 [Thermodesulfobacteriota bacterium]
MSQNSLAAFVAVHEIAHVIRGFDKEPGPEEEREIDEWVRAREFRYIDPMNVQVLL